MDAMKHKITWATVSDDEGCSIQTLGEEEVRSVSGGLIPLGYVVFAVAIGFVAGAGAGYWANRN